jgi:hypothetical protein
VQGRRYGKVSGAGFNDGGRRCYLTILDCPLQNEVNRAILNAAREVSELQLCIQVEWFSTQSDKWRITNGLSYV